MSAVVQCLIRVRRTLSLQLRALESGEVKVLTLLDGGRSDEDSTGDYIQQVRASLDDIDLALRQMRSDAHGVLGSPPTHDSVMRARV